MGRNLVLRAVVLIMVTTMLSQLIPSAGIALADDSDIPDFYEDDCTTELVGIPLNGVTATNTYPDDFPIAKSLGCFYMYPSGDGPSVEITIGYFRHSGEAQTEYDHYKEQHEQLVQSWADKDYINTVLTREFDDRYGYLVYYEQEEYYLGSEMILQHGNYLAQIRLDSYEINEARAREIFRAAEQHIIEIIDSKVKEAIISLRHEGTLDESRYGGGGDLYVALYDEDGNYIAGEEVFLFRDNSYSESAFNRVFHFPNQDSLYYNDPEDKLSSTILSGDYVTVTTDESGYASWNYISGDAIDYTELTSALRNGQEVKGPVYAVVFNKSPRETYDGDLARIKCVSRCEVEIKGVAMLEIGDKSNAETTRVNLVRDGQTTTLNNEERHYLRVGDTVRINNNAIATILWLDGTKMIFQVKSGTFLPDGYSDIQIYKGDAGTFRWVNGYVTTLSGGIVTSGIGGIFGAAAAWSASAAVATTPATAGLLGFGFGVVSVLAYEVAQHLAEELDIEIISHSVVYIEPDEESGGLTVYTIEGTATLYNPNDDSTTDVTTGHKIAISEQGDFSAVETFSESELSAEAVSLIEAAQSEGSTDPSDGSMSEGMAGQSEEQIGSIDHADDWAGSTDIEDSGLDIGAYLGYGGVILVAILVATGMIRNSRRKRKENIVYVTNLPPAAETPSPTVPQPKPPADTGETCTNCGARLEPETLYCSKCGTRVPEETVQGQTSERIFCTTCGASNPGGARFCRRCGQEMKS